MNSPNRTLYRALTSLRHGLHTLFILLLAFGVARNPTPAVCAVAAVTAIIYLPAALRGFPTLRTARWWLLAITAAWVSLLCLGREFMWLEFPLIFLYLRYLPRNWGLCATAGAWATAAFLPAWRFPGAWSVAAALGPGIGTVSAVVFYFAYVTLRSEIDHYRVMAEDLRRAQEDLARSENLAGRLAERERLSREIHDTVAQGLSSIVLLSRAAQKAANPSAHLATIQQSAQESLDEARRFVQDLALQSDLPEALAALVESARRRGAALDEDTSFELVLLGDAARPLPQRTASALERAAREGLTNAARHAHASRVVVTLSIFDATGCDATSASTSTRASDASTMSLYDYGEARVDVVDNGIGITKTATQKGETTSYGLRGLDKRLRDAGGELSVESSPSGTTLSARVPLGAGHD